jgi:phytoene synthase
MPPPLSPLAALVRRHDPDRFLTALFSPPAQRETLFLLYAFNHELARAREVASEPTLTLIRLQWWREVAEGARRRHEVAGPLGEALDQGLLDAADLLAMIEGREAEAEPGMPTLAAWHGYLRATAGAVALAAGRALGADAAALERLRALGTAYGIAGQLRSVAALARQGRCLLPEEVLAAHGMTVHEVVADPHAARLLPALRALAADGSRLLRDAGGRVPRAIVAAALPAVLARRDLRRIGTAVRPRGVGDRLAVLAAGLAGRA